MANLKLKHIDKIYDNHVQAVFDFNWILKIKSLLFLSDHLGVESQQPCV